jgi:DNA repair ATPase RecN
MVVTGQGGTGKSVVIEAITEAFAFHGQSEALAKCATSGIAATHIAGSRLEACPSMKVCVIQMQASRTSPLYPEIAICEI